MFSLILLACIAVQDEPKYEFRQVTFTNVTDAWVVEQNGKKVFMENPGETGYGVVVRFPFETRGFVEVYRNGKFPPEVIKPFRGDEYLAEGQPGDQLWFRVEHDGIPQYFEAAIEARGPPETPQPDKPETGDLTQWVKDNVPDEARVRSILREHWVTALSSSEGRDIVQARAIFVSARRSAFLSAGGVQTDWSGFLGDLDSRVQTDDVSAYRAMMRAVVEGLE